MGPPPELRRGATHSIVRILGGSRTHSVAWISLQPPELETRVRIAVGPPFHNSLQPWLPVIVMAFISKRRIDFPMVDLAKIVYYPRFWDLAHRFYEESWEYTCGMHYNEILFEKKIAFPLVHSEAVFLHPISYGDTVECTITVPRIGETSISWHYEFRNQNGTLCWTADQVTVCTDMNEVKRKMSVPDWMRDCLAKIRSS